jgi:hypothetical protein
MTDRPEPPPSPASKLPFVLLFLMTLAAFGGPVAIGLVLRGGPSPNWPPDRPVEWITFAGICSLVLGIMAVSVMILLKNQREAERLKRER